MQDYLMRTNTRPLYENERKTTLRAQMQDHPTRMNERPLHEDKRKKAEETGNKRKKY